MLRRTGPQNYSAPASKIIALVPFSDHPALIPFSDHPALVPFSDPPAPVPLSDRAFYMYKSGRRPRP